MRPIRTFRILLLWTGVLATALLSACPHASAQDTADAATKRLMAADGLFRRGMLDLAAEEYAEFLKDHPKHPQAATARYGLGLCCYRRKDYAAAVNHVGKALEDRSFSPRDEALAVLGDAALSAEDYSRGLQAFEEILRHHRKSDYADRAAYSRAHVLYLAGKTDQALKASAAFLKDYPDSPLRAGGLYTLALAAHDAGRHEQAAKALQALLRQHPNSPYDLDAGVLLGRCLQQLGRLEPATEQYRKVLASAPDDRRPELMFDLGVVYYQAGAYDRSVQQLARLVKSYRDSSFAAPARLQIGLAHVADGNLDQARKTLEQVIERDSSRADTARYWLAQCDMRQGRHDRAGKTLADLAGKKDIAGVSAEDVHFDLALCHLETGRLDKAVSGFAAVRKRWPKGAQSVEAAYRQAFALHKLGRYDDSHRLAKEVIRAQDSPFARPAAELDAENLFLLGEYDGSAKLLQALHASARSDSQRRRLTFLLGRCHYFNGDYPRAIDTLAPLADQRDIEKDPILREAIFLLGDALLQTRQYPQAARALERYLPLAKAAREEALFKLAQAQLRSDQGDRAAESLEKLVERSTDSPWVRRGLFELGQLCYTRRQPDRADTLLNKLMKTDPDDTLAPPAISLLAWIDYDAGRFDQAATGFDKLVDTYPDHPLAEDAAYQRAAALAEAGRHGDALQALQAYLKAWPEGRHVRAARHRVGTCHARLGQHDRAADILAELAGKDGPAGDSLLYELAWAQRRTDAPQAAIASYARLLEHHPHSSLAPNARAELAELVYLRKQYDRAAELLEKVLQTPDLPADLERVAQYRLAFCLAKLGRNERAGDLFALFAKRHQQSELAPSALYQAGLAHIEAGQADQAATSLARLLDRHAKHDLAEAALLKLGEAQAQAGDYKSSARTYASFLKRYPKSEFTYLAQFGIGWAMENAKAYEQALEWYGKVIATHNGETAARAQFQIGECYFAMKKFAPAARELLKVDIVYGFDKWSASALYEAGRAFEQLGRLDQAREQYKTCVDKYKDQGPARLAARRLKALSQR
jgi:TolA-binding protein